MFLSHDHCKDSHGKCLHKIIHSYSVFMSECMCGSAQICMIVCAPAEGKGGHRAAFSTNFHLIPAVHGHLLNLDLDWHTVSSTDLVFTLIRLGLLASGKLHMVPPGSTRELEYELICLFSYCFY